MFGLSVFLLMYLPVVLAIVHAIILETVDSICFSVCDLNDLSVVLSVCHV